MPTLIAERSKRRPDPSTDETPISRAEIKRLRPQVSHKTLAYIIRLRGTGKRQDAKCLLSKVDAELQKRAGAIADCYRFEDREGVWVAERELPKGIEVRLARRMYRDGLIRKPRIKKVLSKWFTRRQFWHLGDIEHSLKLYAAPKLERDKTRTLVELHQLPNDEMVNRKEAQKIGGFSREWLIRYSDTPSPNRKNEPKPAPPIGRVIKGESRERIQIGKRSKRSKVDPWYRIGDLRECLHARDNPDIPTGGKIINLAIEVELKKEGIQTTRKDLARMVKDKLIEGGKVKTFDKRLHQYETWWMKWDERVKLRAYEKPGGRMCWLNGEDWYPAINEAWRLAGYKNVRQLYNYMAAPFGRGRQCPLLPGRSVRAQKAHIPNKQSDRLVVCAGNDLRDIAEKLTGKRPAAPKMPDDVKAASVHRLGGNGQPKQTDRGRRRGNQGLSEADRREHHRVAVEFQTWRYREGRNVNKNPEMVYEEKMSLPRGFVRKAECLSRGQGQKQIYAVATDLTSGHKPMPAPNACAK
jgi:hypothetical protein